MERSKRQWCSKAAAARAAFRAATREGKKSESVAAHSTDAATDPRIQSSALGALVASSSSSRISDRSDVAMIGLGRGTIDTVARS